MNQSFDFWCQYPYSNRKVEPFEKTKQTQKIFSLTKSLWEKYQSDPEKVLGNTKLQNYNEQDLNKQ